MPYALTLKFLSRRNTMTIEHLLKIGGVYNILCALLHVAFPKKFDWGGVLALLPGDKRPFLEQPLHIMNWCMTVSWLLLGYITLAHTSELLQPGLGRTLLISIVVFWIIRIFILQPFYIGMKDPISWQMTGFFLAGLVLFALPLVKSIGLLD